MNCQHIFFVHQPTIQKQKMNKFNTDIPQNTKYKNLDKLRYKTQIYLGFIFLGKRATELSIFPLNMCATSLYDLNLYMQHILYSGHLYTGAPFEKRIIHKYGHFYVNPFYSGYLSTPLCSRLNCSINCASYSKTLLQVKYIDLRS